MNGDECKVKVLNGVEIQENGIIRNSKGRILGRLVNDIKFESKHLNGKPVDIDKPFILMLDHISEGWNFTRHDTLKDVIVAIQDGDTFGNKFMIAKEIKLKDQIIEPEESE